MDVTLTILGDAILLQASCSSGSYNLSAPSGCPSVVLLLPAGLLNLLMLQQDIVIYRVHIQE